MKKLVAIIICAAALLSLCSCKGKDGNKSDGSVVSDATYFDGTTTVKVDDSAALSALKEGKMSLQKSDDSGFVDVGLGMGVDEFKALFPEGLYTETDRDGYDIYLPVGGQIFVDTTAPSNGAVAIAQYGDIFQFTSTITTKVRLKRLWGRLNSTASMPRFRTKILYTDPAVQAALCIKSMKISCGFSLRPTEFFSRRLCARRESSFLISDQMF